MRFPLIPVVLAVIVVAPMFGNYPAFIMAAGFFTAWSVWLSARREEEAEAVIAELRRQAEARGFELPPPEGLPRLVERLRASRRGKRG